MQTARHLQQIQPSYIREILAAATTEGVISLAGGLPASDHFPLSLMAEGFARLSDTPALFQYGETQGYKALLGYLDEHYRVASGHQMLVCSGSQQGLDLIVRAFLNPGDGVAMEAPCYPGALQVFALAGASIHPVKQNPTGPNLSQLESLFASGKVKLFYAVPDFHNPTGVSWTLDARKQVAALCRQYEVALIEDAPYRELRFAGQQLPLVASFCPERAMVLRSFSKISTPGMRLGVLSAPDDWLAPLLKVKQASDLHTSIPMQALLLGLLAHPSFPAHLQQLCGIYCERYQALVSALSDYLGQEAIVEPVEGGMFVWLQLPGRDPRAVAKEALAKGVAIVPGNAFFPAADSPHAESPVSAIRLNFSHETPDTLREAVRRLASVLV